MKEIIDIFVGRKVDTNEVVHIGGIEDLYTETYAVYTRKDITENDILEYFSKQNYSGLEHALKTFKQEGKIIIQGEAKDISDQIGNLKYGIEKIEIEVV